MPDPLLPRQETGTGAVNVTVRGIGLFLTEDQVKDLHHALYLAYGNDESVLPLWEKIRSACGPEMWARVVADSGRPR